MPKKKKIKETQQPTKEVTSKGFFQKTMAMLNPEDGKAVFETLTEVRNRKVFGISSGSIGIDYIINPKSGGIPEGRVLEIWGPYSSGKTTLALGICANVTANKKRVIYIDPERSFEWAVAINAGVDEEYFILCQHMDARLVANDVETLMKTGEVGAVVVDSVPNWKPLLEGKKGSEDIDITKAQMAFQANFLTNTMPLLAQVAHDHGVVLILINQVRQDLKSYGGGLKPYGCEALKHLNSVRLKLKGSAQYKDDRILDSDGTLVGQYVTVTADKNKVNSPWKEMKLPLFFGRGINPYMEIALLSVQMGVVKNAGNGWFKMEGSDKNIAHGLNEYTQLLYDNTELYMKIRQELIEKMSLVYPSDKITINSFHDHLGNKREIDSKNIHDPINADLLEDKIDTDE
jgi:recombination protein RecA